MSGFNNRPSVGQQFADNILGGNIGGILSTRPSAKYASGARCILKINNKIVGFAFAISWRANTTHTEINTIDDYTAYELAPQRVTVEGTISLLHIPGVSSSTELWQPDILSFLFHKYLSIEVRDVKNDALLFATDQAVIVSRAEDHRVDQLSNVTLNWRAVGFIDEKKPETPDGFDKEREATGSTGSRLIDSVLPDAVKLPAKLTGKFPTLA
jgi:hypothetical protein